MQRKTKTRTNRKAVFAVPKKNRRKARRHPRQSEEAVIHQNILANGQISDF
jgi:hypothetical protein